MMIVIRLTITEYVPDFFHADPTDSRLPGKAFAAGVLNFMPEGNVNLNDI